MHDVIASISPPQRLCLAYLNSETRDILTLFLALDSRINDIHSKMNEAMIAQIRLAWWRDTIKSETKPKGEPLVALIEKTQDKYSDYDVTQELIALIDGWEYLIMRENVMNDHALQEYANGRGGRLFSLIATICNKNEMHEGFQNLGRIWALSLLFHLGDKTAERARLLAEEYHSNIDFTLLSCHIRALALLSHPAVYALKYSHKKQDGISYGLSYIWHAISGR